MKATVWFHRSRAIAREMVVWTAIRLLVSSIGYNPRIIPDHYKTRNAAPAHSISRHFGKPSRISFVATWAWNASGPLASELPCTLDFFVELLFQFRKTFA